MEHQYILEVLQEKGASSILDIHPNTPPSRMQKLGIKKPWLDYSWKIPSSGHFLISVSQDRCSSGAVNSIPPCGCWTLLLCFFLQ